MQPDELVEIGRVAKPWGIKGEVKIRLTTDIPNRFEGLDGVYLCHEYSEPTYHRIEWIKRLKDAVAVKFEGVETREGAEHLRGREVVVPETERAPLDEGEFYIYDLIGLEVVDPKGKPLGRLGSVYQGAAQDIFEVHTPEGPVMVPAVAEYVYEVDLNRKRVVLTLPAMEEDSLPAGDSTGLSKQSGDE